MTGYERATARTRQVPLLPGWGMGALQVHPAMHLVAPSHLGCTSPPAPISLVPPPRLTYASIHQPGTPPQAEYASIHQPGTPPQADVCLHPSAWYPNPG